MHRRQYLGDRRVTHYDLLRFRSLGERIERHRSAQIVDLLHRVKTGRSGTTSYVAARAQFNAYVKSLGYLRRCILRLEVLFARLAGCLKGRNNTYRPRTAHA